MDKANRTELILLIGSALLALAIFIIDINLPLGVAGGIPYIAVIFLSLWSNQRKVIFISAILCSVLIILGFYLSPPGEDTRATLTNRAFVLFAVWFTSMVCALEKNIKAKLELKENQRLDFYLPVGSFLLALAIFAIDINLPLGVAGGVPYIAVIFLSLWSNQRKVIFISAILCSVLIFLGAYFSPSGGELWKVLTNRGLAVSAVWITTLLCLIEKSDKAKLIQAKTVQETLSNTVLNNTIDGIITINGQGCIESFNHAAECLFGYQPSEVMGKNVKMLMPEPYRSEHDQYLKNYIETGVSKIIGIGREVVGLRKDGSTFPLDLGISEMHLGETRMFTGIVRDITKQKEAEEKLRQANRKNQLLLESAGEGIFGLDLDGYTTFVNPAAEKMLGYTEEELLGKLQHALIHHSNLDGSPYPREDCHIYAATLDGKVHRESEEVFWRKDGTPIPVEYVSTPVKENKKVVGAVVTFSNISERKRNERIVTDYTKSLKKANEKLFTSNKELEDFAYIVSHDLKEPLRGIYNYATFVKEDYEDKLDEEGRDKLDTLVRLSQRMEALINDILKYARLGRENMDVKAVDLNTILKEVLDNLQILIQESNVDVQFSTNLPIIACDSTLVKEVFQNLIANGIKYNDKPEKKIVIGFNSREGLSNGNGNVSNESHSDVFYVKDNGIGIDEKYFESIFRIFKRLNGRKKFGDGTGAGTTIVKKIIEKHKGKIWLESTLGEGSTFYFTLEKSDHEQHQVQPLDSHSRR